MFVMLSLPKHLARFVAKQFNEAGEMLRQAQHDKRVEQEDFLSSFFTKEAGYLPGDFYLP